MKLRLKIKAVHHPVAKISGLENLRWWEKLCSFLVATDMTLGKVHVWSKMNMTLGKVHVRSKMKNVEWKNVVFSEFDVKMASRKTSVRN